VTASSRKPRHCPPTVGTATLCGAFTAGASLNRSLTEGGQNETSTGTIPPTSQFDYNTAALASTITGSWSGSLMDGETASLVIDGSGNVFTGNQTATRRALNACGASS
jgi:hypothetical protein